MQQNQLTLEPKFEDYLHAKNITIIEDAENEYYIPDIEYVEKTCLFVDLKNRNDVTPQPVNLSALCTAIIRSPISGNLFAEYYKHYKEDREIEGDNEIDEDHFELFVTSNVIDINKKPLLDELFQVYRECSEENWDGYDSKPITKKAYLEAEKLIRLLPSNIKNPEIIPEPTGEIAFEWHQGKRFTFIISVSGNNIIIYAGLFGSISKIHGTEYFGDKIPTIIVNNINRVFERAI